MAPKYSIELGRQQLQYFSDQQLNSLPWPRNPLKWQLTSSCSRMLKLPLVVSSRETMITVSLAAMRPTETSALGRRLWPLISTSSETNSLSEWHNPRTLHFGIEWPRHVKLKQLIPSCHRHPNVPAYGLVYAWHRATINGKITRRKM